MPSSVKLKIELEALFKQMNKKDFLSSDPVEFVHHFEDPWDQEAMAVLASQLAYGNAQLIRKALSVLLHLFQEMKHTPASLTWSLKNTSERKKAARTLHPFYYRFHKGEDIMNLLFLLHQSWTLYGSLAAHFNFYFQQNHSIESGLTGFLSDWKKWSKNPSRAFLHFLSSPQDKSACKRWCLFLKWMIRKDEIDLGTWQKKNFFKSPGQNKILPQDLVIPVDTHILKISQNLQWTQQKSASWKTALEITQKLKEFDPLDPIKYDFSMSRIGIMKMKNEDFFTRESPH